MFRSALLALALTSAGTSAHAQSTGGSFGSSHEHEGGELGSHESYGGGHESYGESAGTGSYRGGRIRSPAPAYSPAPLPPPFPRPSRPTTTNPNQDYGSVPSGRPMEIPWEAFLTFLFCLAMPLSVMAYPLSVALRHRREAKRWREEKWNGGANVNPAMPFNAVTWTRLSFAFAPTARREIQVALRAASQRPMRGNEGRTLAELLALVQRHNAHIAYAYASSAVRTETEGRKDMRALGMELRARYRADTAGPNRTDAPTFRARAEEGDGLVVVNLVCMRSGANPNATLDSVRPLTTRADVAALLLALLADPSPTKAVDVVWSPSEENDRLSSYELESIYPELVRLAEATEFGTTTCAACTGVHPRELTFCPHCGCPVEAVLNPPSDTQHKAAATNELIGTQQ